MVGVVPNELKPFELLLGLGASRGCRASGRGRARGRRTSFRTRVLTQSGLVGPLQRAPRHLERLSDLPPRPALCAKALNCAQVHVAAGTTHAASLLVANSTTRPSRCIPMPVKLKGSAEDRMVEGWGECR